MIQRNRQPQQPQRYSKKVGKASMSMSMSRQTQTHTPVMWILICVLSSMGAFYGGLIVGWQTTTTTTAATASSSSEIDAKTELSRLREETASTIAELQRREKELQDQLKEFQKGGGSSQVSSSSSSLSSSPHFADAFDQKHTGSFASGMGFVDRDDFAAAFDVGVPLDDSGNKNDRVFLLYSDPKAFPKPKHVRTNSNSNGILSVEEATSNCLNLHLILTHPREQQCIAVMGQYESFHVHKYMRVEHHNAKIDPSLPLRYTHRGHQQNGRISAKIPTPDATQQHWDSLVPYLQSLHAALEDLKPILKEVASHNENNAVIVLTCNFGQSELLLNFICNARAKGLESVLSNVLLFATDQVTHDLAKDMGITSVYIDSIFADMPEDAAKRYADKTFRNMMLAKVYCIQMVSMLGYDILFQDVDVVWYQNPLPWFHDETNPHHGFDMYFQDDGNHALFYAPYSANTGFYYVRNNERTKYFFNSFLMVGDRILSSGSHQIPLIAHLSEHASLHGLRVKTWGRKEKEFPGGYTFHNRQQKTFMKELMAGGEGAKDTYLFHMSWTSSKINKVKFFQQMGEWYLQESCVDVRSSSEMPKGDPKNCCEVAPILTCHFCDKPSKIPCKDSPPIDKGSKSWW